MKVFFRLVDIFLVVFISSFITLLFVNEKEYVSDDDLQKKISSSFGDSSQGNAILTFEDLSSSIKRISDSANPSILWVNANDKDNAFGTGFVIEWNNQTYVLSNYHVVKDSENITAFLFDNSEEKLKLVGYDVSLDLAVLSFSKNVSIPAIPFDSRSNVEVGEFVIAIGHPLGLDYTTTFGIVSKLNRELQLGNNSFTNLIQTDAAINPGNSGGPLINLKGEVIGINTAIMDDSQGLGFAISSADVVAVLDELIQNGKAERPFLGVNIMDAEEGVYVIDVSEDSPADRAGLLSEDVILGIENKETKTIDALTEIINDYKTGTTVKVKIKRDSNILTKEIVIGDKNEL